MSMLLRIGPLAFITLFGACSASERAESGDEKPEAIVGELQGPNGVEATLSITVPSWGSYCGRVTVHNGATVATRSWSLGLDLGSERLTWVDGGAASGSGANVLVESTSSTAGIAPGGSALFRFCATGSSRSPLQLTSVSATFDSGGAGGSGGSSSGGAGGSGGSSSGGAGGSGGSSAGGMGGNSGGSGPVPNLPPITEACPAFKTGTATIAGLSGISLQVGPKQQGSGSLLFYWHGTGSSASEVNALVPKAVRDELLAAGGIIVSFQGSLGTGGDCSGTRTFSKDDFKVADLIAACAVRDHAIDPRRIYTTGCSAGGLQAGCMGAMRSSYIAAAVPNSGGEVTRQPIQDSSSTPAVMTMHGGAADRVVVSFAQTSATYDAHMKGAGSFVVNCNHGGGHCQAPAELYRAGWEFMKSHPFGVEPEPYASTLPSSFPPYCDEY